MNKLKEALLEEAQLYCDHFDKSTEFMIAYMQDYARVDLDTVMEFLQKQSEEKKNEEANTN